LDKISTQNLRFWPDPGQSTKGGSVRGFKLLGICGKSRCLRAVADTLRRFYILKYSDQYFESPDCEKSLAQSTARGGAVMMGGQGARFVMQLASTMVLARLLTPDDFGLIGMVTVILNFLNMFKDFGLSQATIQRSKITRQEISNLFWLNLAVSLFLGCIVAVTAPLVARFYSRPELTHITVVLALFLIFQGIVLQHRALLTRRMKFVHLAGIDVFSMLTGVIVAILMAWYGYSYWALVGQVGGTVLADCVGVIVLCRWQPSIPRWKVSVRPYMKYGLNLAGFNLLNFFSRNADNIMIGHKMGGGALGLYAKAYSLLMLPIIQVNTPMTKVMLPALSRLQSDPERYRLAYLRAISVVISVTFPIVGFFWVASDNLILLLLGDKWLGAIPIFNALIPAAFISALNVTTGWVFLSQGTTNRQLKWTLFAAPLHVLFMFLGLHWGAVGVAWGVSISFCLVRIPYYIFTFKGTPILLRDVLVVISKTLSVVLVAGMISFYIVYPTVLIENLILNLVFQFVVYSMILCCFDLAMFRRNGILAGLLSLKTYVR